MNFARRQEHQVLLHESNHRGQKNRICCLKGVNNQWVWDKELLRTMAVEFYKNFFTGEEGSG